MVFRLTRAIELFAFTLVLFAQAVFPLVSLAAPKVAVSIPPIHSLVQGVMQGAGEAELIFSSTRSPHDSGLSPSTLRTIRAADLVVWVGSGLEFSITKVMMHKGAARQLQLQQIDRIQRWPVKAVGINAPGSAEEDGHQLEHYHPAKVAYDPHIWLSPENAMRIVDVVVDKLSEMDQEQRSLYQANGEQLKSRIVRLSEKIVSDLAVVSNREWIVFHDAYQYFEKSFNIPSSAAITGNPDQRPGVKRVRQIRHLLQSNNIACVFIEPQFDPGAAESIVEGTGARIYTLDPIGFNIPLGVDLWFQLIAGIADSLGQCLMSQ